MKNQFPKIILHAGKERSINLKHPWIFSGAVKKSDGQLKDGDIVEVYAAGGDYLATGHYHDGSIKVRIFSFEPTDVSENFWLEKFRHALELRKSLGLVHNPSTTAYRLIHGEGDGFPGLIVDIYHKAAVVQTHTAGMNRLKTTFADCLRKLFGDTLEVIYDKGTASSKTYDSSNDFLFGNSPEQEVKENDIRFLVNYVEGQKTGFFLDQRDNRMLLRNASKDKTVLNTFCYSGGFSLAALAGGAKSVVSIDSSAKATALAEKNNLLNGFQHHNIITADVFEYLKSAEQSFDIVVLDPPAFAKHLSAVDKAMIGYRNLNTAGIRKVNKGGLLFTFSCSQVIDKQLFRKIVFQAVAQSGRNARILYQLSQGPDHPVSIYHPEGEYLKGLVLYID